MKNFLAKNNFLIFFLLILGISIMNVMKIVKVGLIASISSNLIYSDLCELCFSDYKGINPPESNLAEEAQKIKESNNKPKNNDDTNIKKIKTNRTEDKSKTSAREAETKKNCDASKDEIIPEDIKEKSILKDIEIDNKMNVKIPDISPACDTIKDKENNSSYEGSCDAETSGRRGFNPVTEMEGLDRKGSIYSPESMDENIRKDFLNNTASNTGKDPMITNKEVTETPNPKEEVVGDCRGPETLGGK